MLLLRTHLSWRPVMPSHGALRKPDYFTRYFKEHFSTLNIIVTLNRDSESWLWYWYVPSHPTVSSAMWYGILNHAIFFPWPNEKAVEGKVLQVWSSTLDAINIICRCHNFMSLTDSAERRSSTRNLSRSLYPLPFRWVSLCDHSISYLLLMRLFSLPHATVIQ